MKILLTAVSVLYAALSAFAALSQLKAERRGSHVLMAAGGLVLIAAAVCCLLGRRGDVLAAASGCAMICAAAIWNGRQSGNFHIRHHVVRLILSLALTVGFLFL